MNVDKSQDSNLWHCQLGHMSQTGLNLLMAIGYIPKLQMKTDFCEHCHYWKQTRSLHSLQLRDNTTTLRTGHIDICGPMPKRSLGGS